MRTVFIQQRDGDWMSSNQYNAVCGFRSMGYDVQPFTYEDLLAGKVPVTPGTIVQGGIAAVVEALRLCGVERPANIDMPKTLSHFVGRKIWTSTMGELRGRVCQPETYEMTFIKPLEGQKAFTGYVVRAFKDLIPTAKFDNDYPILCSEVVHFLSEYRFFVLNQDVRKVLNMSHYAGNPLIMPNPATVQAAIEDFTDAPVAYSIDMGVIADEGERKTVLIEVNDAFALGCYGLQGLYYANMIEARWDQMVHTGKSPRSSGD